MVFFINAATTVLEVPENIRMRFSRNPTLQELTTAVESHFTTATGHLFLVDKMMLFDEYTFTWMDLYSSLQLSTDCQVYVFHRSQQQQQPSTLTQTPPMSIPSPTRTISCNFPLTNTTISFSSSSSYLPSTPCCYCCCSSSCSHHKWMHTHNNNNNNNNNDILTKHECRCKCTGSGSKNISNDHSSQKKKNDVAKRRWRAMGFGEKLRTTFNEMDIQQKGYLVYTDFKRVINAQQKVFINHSPEALFTLADRDGDNSVSYKDWVGFATTHPAVMESLFTLVPLLPWFSAKRNRSSLRVLPVPSSRAILEYEEARLAEDAAVVMAAVVGR
ncbi:calmodulin-like protein containing EF hand domain [Trypanosoma theileri]|uniref:Calmodulin-like protein containing EF hand domain n=1 Tax=Trypanosoma theileri TaxID=67003 RepID=A0A1X0NZL4_9TRYP|nr:calmodulin-like protein containing EF hand domain [Trypanosoma theileri]ORC89933.1 calmodulin-like protein containing EF hand domain [Trypanosoma theileri]